MDLEQLRLPPHGSQYSSSTLPTTETEGWRHNRKDNEDTDRKSPVPESIQIIRTHLGLHAHPPVDRWSHFHPSHRLFWSRIRLILREPFAEFWGVFIMITIGNGSVAQVLLGESLSSAAGSDGYGSFQSICWAWGIGVMLGIYVAGDSGAYLNPAVTFTNCVFRGLPWRRLPVFFLAQFLGAFAASALVYANYITAIDSFAGVGVRTVPPATRATAQIFSTYPAHFLGRFNQFFNEFVASALLLFAIFALKDQSKNNTAVGSSTWFPLILLCLIYGLSVSFGYETGCATNPARDFGPRLMSYILGYGPEVWTAGEFYFWVPMVSPFCGCLFGGFLYDLFIYTGPESPLNSRWVGIPYILRPDKAIKDRHAERNVTVPDGGFNTSPLS